MLSFDSTKHLADLFDHQLRDVSQIEQEIFRIRYELYLEDAIRPLTLLYSSRPDFMAWLTRFLEIVAKGYASRPEQLRLLDLKRASQPDWFQRSSMIGYVCYTERFAGTLNGLNEKIPYLQELGITYLHLMPLLMSRPGANDGGYAVMDYRQINPTLGTMADLAELATNLRQSNMSLCIDLVCNHTAKEHEWAQKALAGDKFYQDYYLMFANREMPDQYEHSLPEVFPDFAPGNFTYYEAINHWVWTTFNEYQWDLNYTNPAVFAEMLDIILFLANQGVEILRLDAVAFMWKRLNTNSQNQPEAHAILQAIRAFSLMAAPGLLLLAEAIVPPPMLIPYFGRGLAADKECELAYHNVYMVLLWSSLAEGKVSLITKALQQMPSIPAGCAWLTYARCHDDIGWAITDEDAASVGLNGFLHRAFLSDFYSGRYPYTFARGATFQFNPKTGDRRISGSLASLAGLETALEQRDWQAVDLAIQRILLLHNLIFVFGGIPLIYMGDEIGLLNDPSYLNDPHLAGDNRWLHRPVMDWAKAEERRTWQNVPGRIFQGICQLIESRKKTPALHAQAASRPVYTHNNHVFGLIRESQYGQLLILANFTPHNQTISRYRLYELEFNGPLLNLLTQTPIDLWSDIQLAPYAVLWLQKQAE